MMLPSARRITIAHYQRRAGRRRYHRAATAAAAAAARPMMTRSHDGTINEHRAMVWSYCRRAWSSTTTTTTKAIEENQERPHDARKLPAGNEQWLRAGPIPLLSPSLYHRHNGHYNNLRTASSGRLPEQWRRWWWPPFAGLRSMYHPSSRTGNGHDQMTRHEQQPQHHHFAARWFNYYDQLLLRKVPKGLQDFFPNGMDETNKNGDAAAAPSSSSTSSTDDKDKTEKTAASSMKANDAGKRHNDKKQQKTKQKKGAPPPPDDPDMGSIPGLLALLLLIVTLRHYVDRQDPDGVNGTAQEITWVDFRNDLLHHNNAAAAIDKLVVVNKKTVYVVLKRDAMLDLDTTITTAAHDPDETGASHDDLAPAAGQADGTTLFQKSSATHLPSRRPRSSSRSSMSSTITATPYYFTIGSVESLEQKLTTAQQHLHPSDWIEVSYVSRTNWGVEAMKIVPFVAFVAAVYFGTRGALGGLMGGGGGGRGGGPGGGGIFSVGRSTAKKIAQEDVNVSFDDVAGCQQAKLEVMEFVEFLKDSSRFTKLGAKIPKGALLCGPPGTGKTLLAKAVAGEAGVPFYSISGSDFIEMFVGVGPSRVRDLFKEARKNAPCIVFIDEIDAVGRQRGRGGFSGGGNDERENTLNQLLVEMDGFAPTTGVVVLAGTNRVDILDQALTRPGRFDRQILVDRPDLQGRKEIFNVHLKGLTLEGDFDEYAGRLAGLTPGFAGADIANLCNEGAIVAARRKGENVTMDDFEKATDRIVGGLESNKIMSTEERAIVAHHEAGHAVAGWFLEHADPLLKVTIIPRTSGALGYAQYLPKEVFLRSQDQIMDVVYMALAGRAAEDVFFGRVTTGASDDLRRVTQLVYSMIKDYGMSSRLGQVAFPRSDNDTPGEKRYSDATAEAMDDEARRIVDEAYERTVNLMNEHKEDVAKVAKALLERETVTHDDMVDLIGERPFQGDSVYNEYVTKRWRHKDQTSAESDGHGKDDSTVEGGRKDDLDGLTPGLAYKSFNL